MLFSFYFLSKHGRKLFLFNPLTSETLEYKIGQKRRKSVFISTFGNYGCNKLREWNTAYKHKVSPLFSAPTGLLEVREYVARLRLNFKM